MDAHVSQVERLRNDAFGNSRSRGIAIHDAELVQQLVLPRVPSKLAHSFDNVRRKRIVGDDDTRPRPQKFLVKDLLGKCCLSTSWVAGGLHRGGVWQTSSYERGEVF